MLAARLACLPTLQSADELACRLVIAYASAFAAALYFGFSYVLKRIKPTVFASFVTLQPLLTSCLAFLLLGETFGWHQFFGAIFVISGLFVVITSVDIVLLFQTKVCGQPRAPPKQEFPLVVSDFY